MAKSIGKLKRIVSVLMILTMLAGMCVTGTITAHASSTGIGLANWALNAYYEEWSYVYGGTSPGTVDCSGLIWTYNGVGGSRCDMMGASPCTGSVSNGIPNIHGLGLYRPGHVGVYVGGGMAVDARNEYYGVCYGDATGSRWRNWFYVAGVSYPDTGWEQFGGEYFYYEDGEYLANTERTIDGVTYSFGSDGASDKAPGDMSSVADKPNNNNNSSEEENKSEQKPAEEEEQEPKQEYYRNGDSGDKVTQIQERLKELGYYNGEITGYFGDSTEAAYIKFQTEAGVSADGVAGTDMEILFSDDAPYAPQEKTEPETEPETEPATEPETEETTAPEEEKSSYQIGDEGDVVGEIQYNLYELGYYDGDIIGVFGELTEQAVKDFQSANGLEVTGVADEATIALLRSSDAVSADADEEEETEAQTEADTEPSLLATVPTDAEIAATVTSAPLEKGAEVTKDTALKTNKLASKALDGVKPKTVPASKTEGSFGVVILTLLGVAMIGIAFLFVYRRERKYLQKKEARIAREQAKRYI